MLTVKSPAAGIVYYGHCDRGEWPASTTMARQLRQANPPVIGRIEADQLLLDPRTVLPEQDQTLLTILQHALIDLSPLPPQ